MLDSDGSRRGEILAAALGLVAREGAASVTTRKIAHEARVNLGMLHYLFGSKDALLLAALESVTGTIVAALVASTGTLGGQRVSLTERCDAFYPLLEQHPRASLVRLELMLTLQRQPAYAEAVNAQQRRYLAALADLYDDALGAAPSAISCETFAKLVAGIVDGLAVQRLSAAASDTSQRTSLDALDTLLAMIERLGQSHTPTLMDARVS